MSLEAFVAESNRIEGIRRVRPEEVDAHEKFLALVAPTVAALENFVSIIQPGAKLRAHIGMNVSVGPHLPPPGGPAIKDQLTELLRLVQTNFLSPYQAHQEYETLHPFMDGNGRSGRVLWAWHMIEAGRDPFTLPFLHRWYYDSLDEGSRESSDG